MFNVPPRSRLCRPHGSLRGPHRPAELSGAPTLSQAACRDPEGQWQAGTAPALSRAAHTQRRRERRAPAGVTKTERVHGTANFWLLLLSHPVLPITLTRSNLQNVGYLRGENI